MSDGVPAPETPGSSGAAPSGGSGEVPIWLTPVTYGAVGATQAPDLMRYPPAGYRAITRTARIGHGTARFEFACASALTWGIQRASGFRVRLIDAPIESDAAVEAASRDALYGPDGAQYLSAGDTAELGIPVVGPIVVRVLARVVYLVDEPKRRGFAYGTLPGHPEDGEEAFIVSQREDDSVWLTIRAFSRPSSRWWWAVYPALRLAQEFYTRRYLRALAGPIA
ncbi:MAG: DUF1990 domain-containing protein [Salinibacterium sp.]|nr:DUF1990 domain-containing protein [Salinibacterium sp.]